MTNGDEPATDEPPKAEGEADDGLAQAVAAVTAQIAEIREQLDRLLNVQIDRIRLKLRAGLFWMGSIILLLAIGVAGAAVSVWYFVSGVVGGLTALFGGRVWVGELATGALALLATVLGGAIVHRRGRKKDLERLVEKYDGHEERR